ncbi:MAG TPA: cytochrome C, partial [Algoriphagus sp.]|nr:cytochrome C [Algoriphagus sp.]
MREKSTLRNLLENCLFVWLGLSIVLSVAPESTEFPSFFQVIGRSHPLLLHFPIVLLLAGIIFFLVPSLRNNNEVKNIGELIFLAGANFAGITVVAGLILAKEDYEGEALNWHQWAGFLVFLLSVFIYFFRNISSKTIGFSAVILAIGVILTGHWGANLTHGEDFLLAPLNTEESQVPTMAEAEVFRDIVQPILEAKCVTCHREGKIKGELRLDHLEGIQKGGKTGPFALAGDLENSMMVQRISLPMDAKEHMPPKNKAQLSEEELSILKEWVANGAKFDQKMEELEKESKLYQFASSRFQPERTYEFEAASPETVKELNNFYRTVMPLYPESPALAVSYFGIAAFDPASLNDLKKVKTQVVELSLNKMPLGNLDLSFLEDFNNLEKLTLNFSGLSSKQIEQLGKLSSLQELALSGN